MEEILDQEFNEKEKDETRINRVTAIFRYILIIGYICGIIRFLTLFEGISAGNWVNVIILIFPIYHNLKHARLELKNKYVLSTQRTSSIIAFLLLCFMMIGIFTLGFILALIQTVLPDTPGYFFFVSAIILVIGLHLWVFYREITYYKRATRLKRLNNE